jgi:hypothetical protein
VIGFATGAAAKVLMQGQLNQSRLFDALHSLQDRLLLE